MFKFSHAEGAFENLHHSKISRYTSLISSVADSIRNPCVCSFKVTGYRCVPRARASVSFRSSNPNTANVFIIYARARAIALIIIAIYNARCKCRVQSSGETKTVLIAAC